MAADPSKKIIESIYTDGACSGNPGPGGWGTVVCFTDGTIQELGGASGTTTNNRMEMQAAIDGLEFYAAAADPRPIKLYTDSEYVKNGITKWIRGWKSKGWKTAAGKPVLNQDLWEELDRLNQSHVQWEYVRGHTGNPGNERCDAIARAFSLGQTPQLRKGTTLNGAPLAKALTPETAAEPPKTATPKTETPAETTMPQSDHDLDRLLKPLQVAQEIAEQGFLLTTQEVALLTGLSSSTITGRSETWPWRNWEISRVREEGGQILWQIDRRD
jgi:ribonuclease HI